jgi:hypothetical protein
MHYAWFEDFLKYTAAVSNLFIEWFCSSISSTTRRRHVVGKTRHYHDPLRTPIKRRVIDLNRLSLYTIAWCSHTFLKFQRIWVYQCWRNILIYISVASVIWFSYSAISCKKCASQIYNCTVWPSFRISTKGPITWSWSIFNPGVELSPGLKILSCNLFNPGLKLSWVIRAYVVGAIYYKKTK